MTDNSPPPTPALLQWEDLFRKGAPVRTSDGKVTGHTTGTFRNRCHEGCLGRRVGVRWPLQPGRKRPSITWPCSKGIEQHDTYFQISDGGRGASTPVAPHHDRSSP